MARVGLFVLACALPSAGHAQLQARDLDHAVGELVRTLVNEGRLSGQKVYVGADDFFEEENELRPPLSKILRTMCLRALTDRQVGVALVPAEAVQVLHGRWRRESETNLHLTLFIADPPRDQDEPVATRSADALVPVEGLRPRDIEPTLRHWGDRVVRRLERDLPGSGRFRLHLSPFPVQDEALSEKFSTYVLGHWRPAFTGSDRFMVVGSAQSADGTLHGDVFVAGDYVEVSLSIRDDQENTVASDHVALEHSLFPRGMVSGEFSLPPPDPYTLTELLARCTAHFDANRLTTGRSGNAAECYEKVLKYHSEDAEATALATAGLKRIGQRYDEWAHAAIDRGEYEEASGYVEQLWQLSPDNVRVRELRRKMREVPSVIQSAEGAIGRGAFDEARDHVARLRRLSPGHNRVAELEETIAMAQRVIDEAAEERRQGIAALVPEMVRIRGGCFQMGSPESEEGRGDDERQHRVCVEDFSIAKYEVTFAEYDRFAEATARERPEDYYGRGRQPVKVSWSDAEAYAEWLAQKTGEKYRLPTEAEWEYAARAGSTAAYPWGDAVGRSRANCRGCGSPWDGKRTAPVGSLQANRWGLHDMVGNMWEWTCSEYDWNYGGSETRCASGSSKDRVARGGSYLHDPEGVRSAARGGGFGPSYVYSNNGFRVARSLDP